MTEDFHSFEDYSNNLKPISSEVIKGKLFAFEGCSNNNLISEGSFTRMLNILKTKSFAILSAHRAYFSKQENIQRNRKLRDIFNKKKMGVHQLVGHWLEAPDGADYEKVDKSKLTDTIERSYLVAKPEDMTNRDFTELILNCLTIDGETQDSALIHFVLDETNLPNQDDKYYILDNKHRFFHIGDNLSIGKTAQAYSQYVKKINVPFVFEGLEIPGSNSGRLLFKKFNLKYNY